jgi:hypothetical protein
VKALNLPEGTKGEMVTTLIERFAAKRKRRAQAQPDE